MADLSDPMSGLPDMQSLLGTMLGQTVPNMNQTSQQMSALQDYIRTQQKDQLNIPALQFAAGLLKPTRTGSFGESVGQAGEGALGALQKQRDIDLDRQMKILQLQEGKNSLLAQQAQMLLPYAKMQMASKAFGSAMGDDGDSSVGGTPGAAPSPAGPSPGGIPDPLAKYRPLLRYGMTMGDTQAVTAATELMKNDPAVQASVKGAQTGAEKGAAAPYEMVEVKMPDGSMAKVPLSSIVHPQGAQTTTPAPGGAASPKGGLQVAPPASSVVANKVAGDQYEKVPDALNSLAQQDQRMQAIDTVMQKFQTGAFAEHKADFIAALKAAGLDVKDTDTANPAAFEEFRKNSIGEVFDKVKEMGGQVRVAEITGLGKVVTDPELQPGANAAISAQVRGVIDWRKQMLSDYAKDYEGNKITKPGTWSDEWIKAHPLGNYIASRLNSTPVKGVAPADVPIGGLGIADRDVGNVLHKGDKYVRAGKDQFIPLTQYPDFLRSRGGAE